MDGIASRAGSATTVPGGTGTSTISPSFANSGMVEANVGTISFQGSYSDDSSANLAISLGGATPGSGYSTIIFSSPLSRDGTWICTKHTRACHSGFRARNVS